MKVHPMQIDEKSSHTKKRRSRTLKESEPKILAESPPTKINRLCKGAKVFKMPMADLAKLNNISGYNRTSRTQERLRPLNVSTQSANILDHGRKSPYATGVFSKASIEELTHNFISPKSNNTTEEVCDSNTAIDMPKSY